MRYNFLQKFTSFFLIFSLLFSITVHIPFFTFFGKASAEEEKFYNIVSILVDEDIYNDIRSKLVRYSQDIQGVLENTRAVILPVPRGSNPLDVASLNEKLYFEGYKGVKDGVDFESKLIGTVIVGDVPLPIVFDGSNASKTILPYIDFIEKSYIFDHESGVYKKDDEAPAELVPEIWHGVIAPNSGDTGDNIELIKAYFDKNHEYYLGTGNFKTENGVINGDLGEDNPESYQPYVFYYDQFRETSSINYESYVGYQAYLENIEDITYKRYSTELAQKVQDQVLGIQNENLRDLIEEAIPGFLRDGFSLAPSGPDLQNTPDIQTRYITDNATNKFLEILNSGTLSDIRTYVHNAGRYNTGGNGVNVDMIPFLVSILDAVSGQVVKNVNTSLEKEIDTLVQNGLSRNILIPISFTTGSGVTLGGTGGNSGFGSGNWGGQCGALYENILYGMNAADIENAADCSPYRGSITNSGTLVEANRGYNISLSQGDIQACQSYLTANGAANGTVTSNEQMVRGFWSGNTPLNLNTDSLIGAQFELDAHDLTKSLVPIKDVVGSKAISNVNNTPDPRQCFDNNFLLSIENRNYTVQQGGSDGTTTVSCEQYFRLPISGQSPLRWNCGTNATKYSGVSSGFDTIYSTLGGAGSCLITDLQIGGSSVGDKRAAPNCTGGGGQDDPQVCTCPAPTTRYNFKEITSYITHTSPTSEEFGKQVQALTSPNLPIDKDRYIDFIAANGSYEKINYPYLFRVTPEEGQELTLENVEASLKKHLDDVSTEINTAITAGNPTGLSGTAKTIFDTYLKTGDYPTADFNLYQILQDKELQTYTLDGEEKQLSYYDTLVFAVYWNNLKTPSAKYKFIFENYLSDQFGGNDFNFLLPKNKKSYEVAYLGAPGDAQNMYIKFDPEEKGQNPYAGIIAQNITLNSYLGAANIKTPSSKTDGTFKCAPPDGVPIWQWIPAIICWLQDMLPPKIGISEGSCGPSLLSEEEQEEIAACQGDVNKNGVSDCLEGKLIDGSITLESDSDRYYYNKSGALRAVLKDKNDTVVTLDSVSYVDFELTKVEIPVDSLSEFDDSNIQVIFDSSVPELATQDARRLAAQYVSYSDVRTRVVQGTAVSYFSTKLKDTNLYFSASLTARDPSGNRVINIESPEYQVQVRGDRLFLNSYTVDGPNPEDVYVGSNDVVVSETPKIFLIDTNQKYVEDVSSAVFSENTTPEKTILALTNYSKNGNILPLAYPLTFLVRRDGQDVFEDSGITRVDLVNYKSFPAFTESGKYDFIVRDASGFLATKTLYYVPEIVSNLEVTLGTTVAETGGTITTHLLTLKDRFGNVTSGDIYSVRGEISGGGIVFEEGQDTDLSFNTIEGYKAIRVRSTNKEGSNTLTFRAFDASGTELAQTTASLRTVKDISIDVVSESPSIKVGGGEYSFAITLKDTSGNTLSDFNSRAYMVLNPLYGTSKTSYVDIKNGTGTATLETGTVAARDIKLEFQVEGISGIKNALITILPDVPLKVDLSLSRSRIEASPDDSAILYAVLKDRYENDVFNDSTTILNLEIPDLYKPVIRPGSLQKTVSQGKAQFELNGTEIPGVAYFKVGTTPSLAENSFELIGQAPFAKERLTIALMRDEEGLTERGKNYFTEYNSQTYISRFSTKYQLENSENYLALPESIRTALSNFWDETNALTVRGVSENAGKIETFYFWSKEEIEGNRYNGIYSVLLGAPYGDISQENYLAGSLIFDRDNRALAVTSLLNTPYKYQDIASFTESGNLRNLAGNTDITQDLEYRVDTTPDGILTVDITNAALGNYVGSAYYDIGNSVELSTCSGNFRDCFDDRKTSLSAKTTDTNYTVEKKSGELIFKNNFSQEVLKIDAQGRVIRNSTLYLELDTNNTSNYLHLFVMNGDNIVAEIALNIIGGNINITREQNLISQKLGVLENTVLVYLKSNQYGTRDIFSQDGSSQKVLYYNDPFADSYNLDIFHETEPSGIENFVNEKGLGWEQENKMMLAFAAGESVGESTRDNFSFSLINLGDPVVNLKPERKKFTGTNLEKSFDASLGEVISNDPSVVAYQTFDYNNDKKVDILLAKTDGYVELLENKDIHENYLQKGNLVFAVDGGPARLVKAGDFTGDGYDDIFFVSDRGEPVMFNNVQKNFTRYSLKDNFTLSGAIIQAEVFDMDDDGKTDIVTLDDSGLIHIFYGGGTSSEPSFTKLKVGDGYGIKLSESTTNYGGAVYFDGVDAVAPDGEYLDLITSMEEYNAEMEAALANGDEVEAAIFGQYLVERLLFVPLPYIPYVYDGTPEEQLLEALDDSIPDTNYDDLNAQLDTASGALADFLENYSGYINYDTLSTGNSKNTYFLRSEYADSMDLEITKTFVDTTPEFLQTGDRVNVELTFKNTGTTTLNNIAYVDNIPRNFMLPERKFEVVGDEQKELPMKPGLGLYDYLIDGFFLAPGEEITLRYALQTLPLKYGYMQVGLFEQGEVGDDPYGDIILKPNELNCGEEADIYTSVAVRSYTKGKTTPSCNADSLELPEALQNNTVDNNNNGVPDYIDDLVGGAPEDIQDYSEQVFEDLYQDVDGDGIPNDEDDMPNYDQESGDFMAAIGEINGAIDQISDQVDQLIEGFGCGFGGGSCIATPLNWAPLAPGGDPTLFGYPIGDGLKVNEGIPIFSALTGINIPTTFGCYQVPSVYPVSPIMYSGVCNGTLGAGGQLGVTSPSNYVRLFATPTLTGGFGIAACFGAPAITAGYANPPGVHPIVPGGNCIVAAVPLFGCSGEEGDPAVTGYPWQYGDFGIINANCPDGYSKSDSGKPEEIDEAFIEEFLDYQLNGVVTESLLQKFKDAFSQVAQGGGNYGSMPTGPLISIGGGSETDMMSVDIDPSALSSGNFQDVVQINNTRVSPFPDFLMDWVTRQIEEVVNKLTNLPKVFVILPDFSGIFDQGWSDFGENFKKAFENQKQENTKQESKYTSQIESLRSQLATLNCSGNEKTRCLQIESNIKQLQFQKNIAQPEALSGIRAAYEFLGNVPLVNVETETINISIPWIDQSSIERAIQDWKGQALNWKYEIQRAANQWSLGATCGAGDAACEEQNAINQRAYIEAHDFVQSLERNIEILESYKDFPEQLNKLITIKETRLEQILCNIDAISSLLGGWLSKNGDRFKAWVELFVLIKGILKSWQLLIDVFKGYDEECHQCKNERHDLQNFIFRLISAVIPKLPIIQFPKWPDIILDLHNVRAGLNLYLPEFGINLRPIVLPNLPDLKLPDLPTASFSLPALPILPEITLPELPDLPSLPTVELPDLPPPPKIPKLFGAVEGILNIMKLVTKIMCILKQSPFVPEWRAGDQIAFITERNGYMPMDFIDISLPQFSYPFVDAIKVTTYVNLEFEMEFIVEAVRQIVQPLNSFTNNIANMIDIQVPDFDFSETVPTNIDVDLELNGDVDVNGIPLDDFSSMNMKTQGIIWLAGMFGKKIEKGHSYIEEHAQETIGSKEFIAFVQSQLANPTLAGDPKLDQLRQLWNDIGSLTYSKENKLIEALQQNKDAKFETLTDIISTEIEKTKQLKEDVKNLGEPSFNRPVLGETENMGEIYNEQLRGHNLELVKTAYNLMNVEQDNSSNDIVADGESLLAEVQTGIADYSDKLLAAETDPTPSGDTANACTYGESDYEYRYKGLYVLEYDRHYRLFEYLDELRGDERTEAVDIDDDGDDDLFYFMNNTLYLKENYKNTPTKEYISTPPLILNARDNTFFNGDTYYESVNGFEEADINDSFINISFKKPTNPLLHNFRAEFFTIVDRFRSLGNPDYIPTGIKKFVVDAFENIDDITLLSQTDTYTTRKHLAYLTDASVIPGVTLTDKKFLNIREDIEANNLVQIAANREIYAGKNNVSFRYYDANTQEEQTFVLQKNTSIAFQKAIQINSITGNAYIVSEIHEDITGAALVQHLGLPLFPGAKITYNGNDANLTASSHLDIRYYDGSQANLHFRDVYEYRLYDLGNTEDRHLIRLAVDNDFYYAKMYAFKDNLASTYTHQILLSPQKEADQYPPEIGLRNKIRIPVYQQRTVDLTPYIYEDSGIANIRDVEIDFDLNTDSDGDGFANNDADADTDKINILRTPTTIKVQFGPYDTLFTRKIRVSLTDGNDNTGYKDVDFEVYTPDPQIQNYEQGVLYGEIDETLLNEPVRIYRVRGGTIKKLQESDGNDLVQTDSGGSYQFGVAETSSGLLVKQDNLDVARVNEYTGVISLLNPAARIEVLAANDNDNETGFPRMSVKIGEDELFYQYLQTANVPDIQLLTDSYSMAQGEGIGVNLIDQERFGIYKVPFGVAYNPGAIIVYDNTDIDKKELFSVFRDGRIYLSSDRWRIRYKAFGTSAGYEIVDTTTDTVVMEVVVKLEASYILR